MRLVLALVLGTLALAACSPGNVETAPPARLGDFRLGFLAVVAKGAQPAGPSRPARAEEWEAVLKEELERRLRRYEGDRLYHLGVRVAAFALAPRGVPLLVTPKSALVLLVTVWDDACRRKFTAEPQQILVFEEPRPGNFLVGSGWANSREAQMRSLARTATLAIERFLASHADEWFTGHPAGEERCTATPAAGASPDTGSEASPAAGARLQP